MARFLNAATLAAGGPNCWLDIADEERSDLFNPRFYWTYHERTKENANAVSLWQELWPLPKLSSGDSTVPGTLGQDPAEAGRFEYPSTISRGMARPWLFRGICTDQGGSPLGGAVVKAFLTTGDLFVGQSATDATGFYECPTIYYGQNHYLVASIASGNLAGVTVNTLQPSL